MQTEPLGALPGSPTEPQKARICRRNACGGTVTRISLGTVASVSAWVATASCSGTPRGPVGRARHTRGRHQCRDGALTAHPWRSSWRIKSLRLAGQTTVMRHKAPPLCATSSSACACQPPSWDSEGAKGVAISHLQTSPDRGGQWHISNSVNDASEFGHLKGNKANALLDTLCASIMRRRLPRSCTPGRG
jgi:hypothetical protein